MCSSPGSSPGVLSQRKWSRFTAERSFGDALDLNPHSHSLVLDGAYVVRHGRFEGVVQIGAPSDEDVAGIAVQVAKRVVRMLGAAARSRATRSRRWRTTVRCCCRAWRLQCSGWG